MNVHTKTLSILLPTLILPVGCFEDDAGRDDDMMGMDDPSGMDGADEEQPSQPLEPEPGMAMIRVIHGAPRAPDVDVYVKGSTEPVVTDLAYGDASEYLEVPAGRYEFEVRAAGTSPYDEAAYETGVLELADGAVISALAAGRLGSTGDEAFRVLPLLEGFDDAAPGQTQVRIVHAGSDAPTVSIDVDDDGRIELDGLTRFSDTGAGGVGLPAGSALQVAIGADGERVTAFTTPELPEGRNLMIIATGLLGELGREDDGFALLVVGAEGSLGFIRQNPIVHALHASPDAAEVDLCVGDTVLASHLEFGKLARFQVPPGAYQVDFYAAPSNCAGTPITSDSLPELDAGERYLAIATGEVQPETEEPPLQLIAFRDGFDLDSPENAIFNVVHAASAPPVDVGLVTGTTIEGGNLLEAGLKWPGVSDTFAVQPFTYQIGMAASGAPLPLTPVASFHVDAYEGLRAFIVAAGDLSPELGEAPFRLLSIDTATTPWTVDTYLAN
ncbi:MAG: DUF4397 domain-containing protein [Myxococcales bacterium]|nr:DUF4397 domain-containing protein [Myxococcales bacterium]